MSKDKFKSKENKKTRVAAASVVTTAAAAASESETVEIPDFQFSKPDYFWLAGCLLVTAIAAFLRFWQLELKPLHHDEGVNGYFLKTLFEQGVYNYDPTNYHGPTLYYITLAFAKIFGLEIFSIRAGVAVFGVLIVVLTFFLRKYIGAAGSLFAALLLALSPGMVFISRYFIHEIFFVFCSLGVVLGVLFFIEGRKAGVLAVAWMTLLVVVCFLPLALSPANHIGGENLELTWALRIAFFAVEAVLVFFLMHILLDWNEGRPVYLLLAAGSAALFFATKETAFITLGTMLMACACVWLWRKIYGGIFGEIKESEREPLALNWSTFRKQLGASTNWEYVLVRATLNSIVIFLFWSIIKFSLLGDKDAAAKNQPGLSETDYIILAIGGVSLLISAAIWFIRKPQNISKNFIILEILITVIFIYVSVLFFSSFFSYPEGISKAFEAYAFWTKTGTGDHTQNGTWAYLKWGMKIEAPIFILAAFGTLLAFVKARHRFAMFAGLWAFGLFVAYTVIPYKTPWLALSFILPMCLVAGYGINELAVSGKMPQKVFATLLTIIAAGFLGYQTYDLNFVRYDDATMPYVYAHTERGFLGLITQIEHYAEKSGKGREAAIEIVSPDYWSMPWYTRSFPHADYQGKIVPADAWEMIVAKKDEQDEDIIREYSADYKYAGTYPLRPGVELYLLVRRDLADEGAKEIYEINDKISE